jgi:hypothetical protein
LTLLRVSSGRGAGAIFVGSWSVIGSLYPPRQQVEALFALVFEAAKDLGVGLRDERIDVDAEEQGGYRVRWVALELKDM